MKLSSKVLFMTGALMALVNVGFAHNQPGAHANNTTTTTEETMYEESDASDVSDYPASDASMTRSGQMNHAAMPADARNSTSNELSEIDRLHLNHDRTSIGTTSGMTMSEFTPSMNARVNSPEYLSDLRAGGITGSSIDDRVLTNDIGDERAQ